MRRFFTLMTVLLLMALIPARAEDAASAGQDSGAAYTSLAQLADKRIGIPSGTSFDLVVRNSFPKAKLMYYNSQSDLLMALAENKIDAFPSDEPVIRYIMNQRTDITYIPDYLEEFELAFCFAKTEKGQRLCEQVSAFTSALKADGSLDALSEKWFSDDESKKTIPDISGLSAENGTLRLVTDGDYMPFEYVRGGQVVGYDIDLAVRFCQAYGYGLKIEIANLDAVLAAVQSGKCDMGASAITITPERAESVLFAEPNYTGGTVMVVKGAEVDTAMPAAGFTSVSQLHGRRIGVQTGTTFDEIVLETLPDAKISYFNSYPDMAAALKARKIDGFPGDEPVLQLMASEDSKIRILADRMDTFEFGFVLPKDKEGEKLRDEMNAWLTEMKADGELERIIARWTNGTEEDKIVPDYASYPAPNGVLTMATEGAYAPMNYYRKNEVVGFEIELAARFCEARGYGLRVQSMLFDAILPAVQAGKADFAAAGMTITEERKESVYFSDPYYTGGTVMAVLRVEQPAGDADPAAQGKITGDGIVTSFNKTFLREERWKLFLTGVGATLLITLLSILFGTGLGFLVFMLCRNGNPVANGLTRFSMWLVQGTPMVVLLMILYYIIFGSVAINGITVAVIGFTLTFGSAVVGLLRMGVGTIDQGQYEAAYALGHSNRHTFFRIILPQAIPHVLPAYLSEITGLIKATAIVGYIAVQDLTKMGDIVRSRTYEAFFPLIAVTVFYFVLEGLFSFAVGRIRISIDPRKRGKDKILKGIKIHDGE